MQTRRGKGRDEQWEATPSQRDPGREQQRLHRPRENSRDYTIPERPRKQRPPAKAPGNGKVQAFQ